MDTKSRSVEPPKLPKQYVNLVSDGYRGKKVFRKSRRANYSLAQQQYNNELAEEENFYEDDDDDEEEESQSSSTPDMGVQQTTAETGITNSTFHIPRNATVPSDDAPHKVTITIIDLDSKLSHYSVPKLYVKLQYNL